MSKKETLNVLVKKLQKKGIKIDWCSRLLKATTIGG